MQKNYLLHAVASSLLIAGCMGSAQVRGSASVSAPELVFISPGVQVIADYREPIFYTENYYWRYQGNVWYRSSNYTGGWVRYSVVPVAILRIERPAAYIHYRGGSRVSGPVVRDHRDAPQPTPTMIREERKEERKEEKAEQKEERKEQKAEQKEERKEQKEERKEQKEERKDDRKDAKDARKGRP